MKKRYLILLCFNTTYLLASEPSAFSAGDLGSENPYGLTESEKAIVYNKKATEENRKKINSLNFKMNEIKENIEGLRTVVDSISSKVGKTDQQLSQIKSAEDENSSSDIDQIKNEINEIKKVQQQNYMKIERVLKELSSLIDSINNSYVSKNELNNALKKK